MNFEEAHNDDSVSKNEELKSVLKKLLEDTMKIYDINKEEATEFITAYFTVQQYENKLKNKPKKLKNNGGSMLKVAGKHFRCHCGCNVFHQYEGENEIYICNACKENYESE